MLHFAGVLVLGAATLVALAASVGSYNSISPGPSAFVRRGGAAFVVPMNRAFAYFVVSQLLATGWLVSLSLTYLALPVGDDTRLVVVGVELGAVWVAAAAWAVVVARMVSWAMRERPSAELTADALTIRDPFGTRTIPWESMRPGLPAIPAHSRFIPLAIDR